MNNKGVIQKLQALVLGLTVASILVAGLMGWRLYSSTSAGRQRLAASDARLRHALELVSRASQTQNTLEALTRERDPDKLELLIQEAEKAGKSCESSVANLGSESAAAALRQALKSSADVREQVLKGEYATAQSALLEQASPAFEALLAAIMESEKSASANAMQQADSGARTDTAWQWGVSLFAALSLGAMLLTTFGALRGVKTGLAAAVDNLDQAARQIGQAASQVLHSSQALARGASDQAASLEQTSASSDELQSMTARNSSHAGEATTLLVSTSTVVDEANSKLAELTASMSAIRESSGKISHIIRVIDEIAFQTNILALNAAVEAARAGEMGLGFAVVADEVRGLAQRSAQAAGDTTSLIQAAIDRAGEGSSRLEEVSTAIARITAQATQARQLSEGVSAGSRDQAEGISQISTTLARIQKVTQETAASAEESSAASEQLNSQCGLMRDTVDQLRALVGG